MPLPKPRRAASTLPTAIRCDRMNDVLRRKRYRDSSNAHPLRFCAVTAVLSDGGMTLSYSQPHAGWRSIAGRLSPTTFFALAQSLPVTA